MTKVLKGDIKTVYVKDLTINEGIVQKIELDEKVLKKDAEFYENFLGILISFDYDTHLPSYEEAYEYVHNLTLNASEKMNSASCFYFDSKDACFDRNVSSKELKQLKKQYKEIRKR